MDKNCVLKALNHSLTHALNHPAYLMHRELKRFRFGIATRACMRPSSSELHQLPLLHPSKPSTAGSQLTATAVYNDINIIVRAVDRWPTHSRWEQEKSFQQLYAGLRNTCGFLRCHSTWHDILQEYAECFPVQCCRMLQLTVARISYDEITHTSTISHCGIKDSFHRGQGNSCSQALQVMVWLHVK